jgi:hypothetical protein
MQNADLIIAECNDLIENVAVLSRLQLVDSRWSWLFLSTANHASEHKGRKTTSPISRDLTDGLRAGISQDRAGSRVW